MVRRNRKPFWNCWQIYSSFNTFSYSLLSVFLWRYKLQVFQNAGLHLLKVNIVKCLYVREDSL